MTTLTGADLFLGIDVGTQGIRVVAIDDRGKLVSTHRCTFGQAVSHYEQSPRSWWDKLRPLLQALAKDLRSIVPRSRVVAVSATSTSGTIIPLDANHQPLHPALLYSDDRAVAEAAECRKASLADAKVAYGTSYGLPKMLWYSRTFPQEASRIRHWCHAGDYILGLLSGAWDITDPTTALKSGFDPVHYRWPAYIEQVLGLPSAWFPRVIDSGDVLAQLAPDVANEIGLPTSVLVTTGMTDGCASQVAAGAVRPGEWSTTIGTTLVIKGVTHQPIHDVLGRIYNHRHPQGFWMPGGASHTGAAWVAHDYGGQDLGYLNTEAEQLLPTSDLCYPLPHRGERFPFVAPQASGFEPDGLDPLERYACRMEGVAYLERLGYELVERLSGEEVERVSTAGGASQSSLWLRIRANVLGKPIVRMHNPDAAVGIAIVAASKTTFSGLEEAARAMTHADRVVEPGELVGEYELCYRRFVQELTTRGYLSGEMAVTA